MGSGDVDRESADSARDLLGRLAGLVRTETDASRADIDRSKVLIRDATGEMQATFDALEALATEQKTTTMGALELMQNAKFPSKDGSSEAQDFSSFVADAHSTLEGLTKIIAGFARENIKVTYSVEDLVSELELVFDNVKLVDGIADDTAMLAINAALEAARAGELGKGFGVVSAEVRKLSHTTKELNEVISDHVERANVVVNEVREAVNWMAQSDLGLDEAVSFGEKVRFALEYIEELNRTTGKLTSSMDTIFGQVEDHVSNAMRALQFEDIVTQVMEVAVARFETFSTTMEDTAACIEGENALSVLSRFVEALEQHVEESQLHMPADQDTIEEGEAFLF